MNDLLWKAWANHIVFCGEWGHSWKFETLWESIVKRNLEKCYKIVSLLFRGCKQISVSSINLHWVWLLQQPMHNIDTVIIADVSEPALIYLSVTSTEFLSLYDFRCVCWHSSNRFIKMVYQVQRSDDIHEHMNICTRFDQQLYHNVASSCTTWAYSTA